jgi:hypothetical protein
MMEDVYNLHRNEAMVDGLYGFVMTDQIGLILHEVENMGNPNAKIITATRLLIAMTCPSHLSDLTVDFVPGVDSLLHEDATKLCVGDESCLLEVQKAVFGDSRYMSGSVH